MALRTKTIEYCWPMSIAATTSGTAIDLTSNTIYIPESSPTFRSVILEVSRVDNAGTAASHTAVLMGIGLNAVARSDATVTMTITNSGENYAMVCSRDVTSYFSTNWTGTSMTGVCRVTWTGVGTINTCAKIMITYQYDDAAATTRIKTVRIPIDGNTGNLTTSLVALGTNQWPELDTFLPEASKVYRDIFFEMNIHTGTTAAATAALTMRYDGATSISDGSWAHSLNTDTFYRRIDKLLGTAGAPTTSAAHAIEASTTSVTGKPCPCLNGVITVTYEYDHSASTSILNSLMIPVIDEMGWIGGTTTADKSRYTRELSVQEPGTVTLVQSGVLTSCIDAGAVTIDLRMGAQTSRTFAHAATARAGSVSQMRRIDSGATGGAGLTLARGYNTLVLDWFTTSATAGNIGSNMAGVLFLNYTSDKHADGDGVHGHTTFWLTKPYVTGGLVQRVQAAATATPNIPETNYWLMGLGYQITLLTSGTASGSLAFAMQAEVQAAEAEGAGWRTIYAGLYASDAEIGPSLMWARARTEFKRYPNDTDSSRLNVETARDYRFDVNVTAAAVWQAYMFVSYHCISYAISGTVTGSSGGTVTITAFRADTGEKIDSTTRVGNGSYTMPWYDNTTEVFAEARESGTLIGRSDNSTAV